MYNDIADPQAEGDGDNDDDGPAGNEGVLTENVDAGDEDVFIGNVDEAEEDDAENDIEAVMNEAYGETSSGHNLRPRREVSYLHLHINFEEVREEHKGVGKQPWHYISLPKVNDWVASRPLLMPNTLLIALMPKNWVLILKTYSFRNLIMASKLSKLPNISLAQGLLISL